MLNVGFLTPSLALGGAEIWIETLAERLQRCRPVGCVLTNAACCDPGLRRRVEAIMPVHVASRERSAADLTAQLSETANVLIAWGLPSLPLLTAGLRSLVIEVAHSDISWPSQAALLKASASKASVRVGVSRAAGQAWTIYNGASLSRVEAGRRRGDVRAELGILPRERLALFVGRLEPVKAPHRLVRAISLLDDWKAVFVGGGALRDDLRDFSADYAPGRCLFQPPTQNVGDFYRAADVFCLNSHFEGFPLVLAEAWLSRIPTVTTPFAFAAEMQDRHGNINTVAADTSAAAIAAAIETAATGVTVERAWRVASEDYTAAAFARRWDNFIVERFCEACNA